MKCWLFVVFFFIKLVFVVDYNFDGKFFLLKVFLGNLILLIVWIFCNSFF